MERILKSFPLTHFTLNCLYRYQMVDLSNHSDNGWRSFNLNGVIDPLQAQRLNSSFLALASVDNALYLGDLDFCHDN